MRAEEKIIEMVRSGDLSVDQMGRIWRHRVRRGRNTIPCEPRRAEHRTPLGYLQIRAMIDGRRYHVGAHRIVWWWFNGPIPEGHEINHLNGQKGDNRPQNLSITTRSDNARHAHAGGLIDQHGQKNPSAKLTDNQVAQIRLAYSSGGYTQAELAERYGVTHQTISRIIRGGRRSRQLGRISKTDHRHCVCERGADGRYVGKKAAGRKLDGRTWDELPNTERIGDDPAPAWAKGDAT